MSIFELIDSSDAAGLQTLINHDPSALAARDESGVSPLMRAAYRGNNVIFETLAAVGSDDPWDRLLLGESEGIPAPDAWSPDGFTPYHIAAFGKNVAATEALLDARANPNVFATASFARVTPLGTCAFVGATEVGRALMRRGADPSVAEVEGGSPLDVALQNGHRDLVALMVVWLAHTDVDAVASALEVDPTLANAAVDWGSGDWESALGAAAHMLLPDMAELLLAHGARLDVFAAAMLGMVDVVRPALEADPRLKDTLGPHGIPLRDHAQGPVVELFS